MGYLLQLRDWHQLGSLLRGKETNLASLGCIVNLQNLYRGCLGNVHKNWIYTCFFFPPHKASFRHWCNTYIAQIRASNAIHCSISQQKLDHSLHRLSKSIMTKTCNKSSAGITWHWFQKPVGVWFPYTRVPKWFLKAISMPSIYSSNHPTETQFFTRPHLW